MTSKHRVISNHTGISNKGFSLFTPLVGTAVIIISVFIASSMTANNIRISQALGAAFTVNYQTTTANAIRASTEAAVVESMELIFYEYLLFPSSPGNVWYFKCDPSQKTRCWNEVENAFIGRNSFLAGVLRDNLFIHAAESLGSASGYALNETTEEIQTRFSAALAGTRPFDIVFDNEGRIMVSILAEELQDKETDLALRFTDPTNPKNQVKVSVVPHGFSVKTSENIKEMFSKTLDIYTDANFEYDTIESINFRRFNGIEAEASIEDVECVDQNTGEFVTTQENLKTLNATWVVQNSQFKIAFVNHAVDVGQDCNKVPVRTCLYRPGLAACELATTITIVVLNASSTPNYVVPDVRVQAFDGAVKVKEAFTNEDGEAKFLLPANKEYVFRAQLGACIGEQAITVEELMLDAEYVNITCS